MPKTMVELEKEIENLKAIVQALQNTIQNKDREIQTWSENYYLLRQKLFGKSSEKQHLEKDPQYLLFDEAEAHADENAQAVTTTTVAQHERKKRGRKAKDIPLPVIEKVHELEGEERSCPCCGKERPVIGEQRSSEYDLVPAHFVKIVHVRRKYGPCKCEGFEESEAAPILIAPAPAKIIPGSDFSNRTTAFFMTAKYADAIPFYRMEKMLARYGLILSRATLSNQAIAVGRAIEGLIDVMNRDLMSSPVLLMDETTVQVLEESGKENTSQSCMWVQRGFFDGRPIHRFSYHPSRSGSFAENLLTGFKGFYLQTDGYKGYDRFHDVKHPAYRTSLVHVGCFAHIRRKFVDAWEVAGKTGIAQEAIRYIANLYEVERELRKQLEQKSIDESTFISRRKRKAEPHLSDFRMWLTRNSLTVAPQSKLGMAISYALVELPLASRYIDHPLLTPDTNAVENAIRPFVIGRKNWLFSGSPRGAHASAGIYSLIETAKANGHDPYFYLCFIFDRLPLCKTEKDLEKLLPYRVTPEEVVTML
jgi:transposase